MCLYLSFNILLFSICQRAFALRNLIFSLSALHISHHLDLPLSFVPSKHKNSSTTIHVALSYIVHSMYKNKALNINHKSVLKFAINKEKYMTCMQHAFN